MKGHIRDEVAHVATREVKEDEIAREGEFKMIFIV